LNNPLKANNFLKTQTTKMSSEQGFTTVGKNAKKIIKVCDFCKKNRDPTCFQHSKEECTKVVCNWCKTPGHIKHNCEKFQAKVRRDEQQKMKEERIAAMTCPWCKEKGHGWDFCEKRKESFKRKEEKQKKMDQDFPATIVVPTTRAEPVKNAWATVAKENRDEKIVEKIKLTEEQIAKKAKENKEKAHADYLERKRLREEYQKIKDAQYVCEMEERFGTKWFNWVNTIEGGKYDSAIAANLRYEYYEEQLQIEYKQEEIEQQRDKRLQEEEEREIAEEEEMRRTLSPKAFQRWRSKRDLERDEEMDTWLELGSMNWYKKQDDYMRNAPPLYREYCAKTCQKLDWNEKILENRELSWPTKK
jgi:hypothetical protein